MRALAFVAGTAAAVVLFAGCVRPEASPAQLTMSATWGPFENDPLPHLLVSVVNLGGSPGEIGRDDFFVRGPTALVPIDWDDAGSRSVASNEMVVVAFHPRQFPDGSLGLAIDHASGLPMALPPGMYEACLPNLCEHAHLGPE